MKKLGLIDRVPPIVRHLLILLVPPLLAWLASDVVPALDGQGGWVAVAAGVLSQLVLVLTTLTRQYGVGAGQDLRQLPDGGRASLRQLWLTSGALCAALLLIATAMLVGPAKASPATAASACPAGYLLGEVHVPGQRIEAGIDPVTHLTVPALAQSQPGDARYVVALACVRDLTVAERDAQRAGLSTVPLQLPLALPAAQPVRCRS